MISEPQISRGDRAPDFCLPGISPVGADVHRLSDHLEEQPILLTFATERAPRRVVEDVAWFQFMDSVRVLTVLDREILSLESSLDRSMPAAPLLTDPEGEIAEAYGVDPEASDRGRDPKGAIFLVDRHGVVCRRWPLSQRIDLERIRTAVSDLNDGTKQ